VPTPRKTLALDTRHVGRRVLWFDTLPSTSDVAAELAADPENAGTVVVADDQTAGRGQHGRTWHSRPGASLLFSAVVFPPAAVRRPVVLTAWAAVAVGDAAFDLTGVQAKIKWPNDLLVRGKKLSGILIEQHGPAGTVAGIGLNLNQSPDDFAAAGLPDATSLAIVGGRFVDPVAALEAVVRRLDAEWDRLLAGEVVPLEADWKWRTGLLGREVVVEHFDGTTETGRLREMGFDGLELEGEWGGLRVVRPETVRHVREAGR
jgi:BirA family biotin operon repressor/biotin-[acetyl-CoA-carboxylase] ligase